MYGGQRVGTLRLLGLGPFQTVRKAILVDDSHGGRYVTTIRLYEVIMKFKLASGDSTFSFEGELSEAIALLDAYWNPQSKIHLNPVVQSSDPTIGPPKSKPKRRGKSAPTGAAATSASSVTIDAQGLSNKIKLSPHFKKIKSKILVKQGDWVAKCKMVAHFAEEPITSGDVKRTMDAFKIKASLPTLSRALSNNSDLFLTSGDKNAVKYELTASAEESFLIWLESSGNE